MADQNNNNNNNHRQRYCRFYLLPGGCRKGDRCTFAHERPLCEYFKVGCCLFGNQCKYSHELKPLASAVVHHQDVTEVSFIIEESVHDIPWDFDFEFEEIRYLQDFARGLDNSTGSTQDTPRSSTPMDKPLLPSYSQVLRTTDTWRPLPK